jgi:hypothetical protein
MAGYSSATQTRIESMFGNMLRTDREESSRIVRLYQVVTWAIFPRVDHRARKQATAAFFRRLADYADEQVRRAGA